MITSIFTGKLKLRSFSTESNHLRPFHCDVCAKSFSQAANLKTHIRNTHPEVADALAPPRRSASATAATPNPTDDDDDYAAATAAFPANAAHAAAAAASLLPPKSEADH